MFTGLEISGQMFHDKPNHFDRLTDGSRWIDRWSVGRNLFRSPAQLLVVVLRVLLIDWCTATPRTVTLNVDTMPIRCRPFRSDAVRGLPICGRKIVRRLLGCSRDIKQCRLDADVYTFIS